MNCRLHGLAGRRALVLLLTSSALAGGCAPAEVAGNYTVAVTNGENGCSLDNWTEGESTSMIGLVITQSGGDVQATVQGLTGAALELVVGSNIFSGDVAGDRIRADLIGDNAGRQGECSYTFTVEMDARVDGDVILGDLTWRPVTNAHPDCGILESCRSVQSFNGTRPPTP